MQATLTGRAYLALVVSKFTHTLSPKSISWCCFYCRGTTFYFWSSLVSSVLPVVHGFVDLNAWQAFPTYGW